MTNGITYHQCSKCQKQYLTLRGIIKHIRKKHPDQKVVSGYQTLQSR
jgi:hypothetical protein